MRYNKRSTRNARRDVAERFWEKVNRSTPDACWEWTASLVGATGYGQFQWDRKIMRAHRVAYMLVKGTIPEDMRVCHSCDNRKCVNPAHLFLGTQRENLADMDAKGRRVISLRDGEKNNAAKVTDADVVAIRTMSATRRFSQAEIGEKFGIDQTTVSSIVLRKSWKHIE